MKTRIGDAAAVGSGLGLLVVILVFVLMWLGVV